MVSALAEGGLVIGELRRDLEVPLFCDSTTATFGFLVCSAKLKNWVLETTHNQGTANGVLGMQKGTIASWSMGG